jgi:hypothetical protein
MHRQFCSLVLPLIAGLLLVPSGSWLAGAEPFVAGSPVADYRSEHFVLHSDLPGEEADRLLTRLESMLNFLVDYWGEPLAEPIECFVVKRLANWPDGKLAAEGRAKIEAGVGITLTETVTRDGTPVRSKAVVYSVGKFGTVLHEVVHAYCGQTFHMAGPLWYAEGMAEVGQYWRPGDTAVRCPQVIVKFLRNSNRVAAGKIVTDAAATGDSWQAYAHRWALCHFLTHNSNYAERFSTLGHGYLRGSKDSFVDLFGSAIDQLEFEYRFFIDRLEVGLRADLIAWDWSKRFASLSETESISARVLAMRGWQPTGVRVETGQEYRYSANGKWSVDSKSQMLSAAGNASGRGRLIGVILQDRQLGKPFALGEKGTFQASTSGDLYLRCQDDWHSLGDNKGELVVTLRFAINSE